jgi:hypothetical protein
MEGSEYMYTAAEIGVALAGFAALVISFRQRQDLSLSESDRLVVASLVERGLMAAFFSFLPILLFGLGLSERLIWFFSSGIFVAYGVSIMIRSARSHKISRARASNPAFYFLYAVGVLMVALQICHASALGLRQSVWWYLVAVTWLLVSAGYRFFFVLRGWVRAT